MKNIFPHLLALAFFFNDTSLVKEDTHWVPQNRGNLTYQNLDKIAGKSVDQLNVLLEEHQKRIERNKSANEVYESLMTVAYIKEILGKPYKEVTNSYMQAYAYNPKYIEPLEFLALYQERFNDFDALYDTAKQGLLLQPLNENLLKEYALATNHKGEYVPSFLASELLLSNSSLSPSLREEITKTLQNTKGKFLSGACLENNGRQEDLFRLRYAIYLAKSYKEAGNFEKALIEFETLVKEKNYSDAFCNCYLEIGELKEKLKKPYHEISAAYYEAYKQNPKTPEALFQLSQYFRKIGDYQNAYEAIQKALQIQNSLNCNAQVQWLNDYGLLLEYSIAAYKNNLFLEAFLASMLLSQKDSLPNLAKEVVESNRIKIQSKLSFLEESNVNHFLKISSPEIVMNEHMLSLEENHSIKPNFSDFQMEPNNHMTANEVTEFSRPKRIEEQNIHVFRTNSIEEAPHAFFMEDYDESIFVQGPSFPVYEIFQTPELENCEFACNSGFTKTIYLDATVGRGLGNVDAYQTVGAFLRYPIGCFETIFDLRGLHFCQDKWGANCGIGLRYYSKCTNTVLGINAFYDYRDYFGDLNQLGVGAEFYSNIFTAFVNYYAPFGHTRKFGKSHTFTYPGGYFAKSTPVINALQGGDFEIGTYTNQWFCPSPLNLYLGAGAYIYEREKGFNSTFAGARYRAELSYYDLIYLGFVGTSDHVFHHTFQGYFGISISFDRCGIPIFGSNDCCCYSWDPLNQPIRRYPVIVGTKPCCKWETNYSCN